MGRAVGLDGHRADHAHGRPAREVHPLPSRGAGDVVHGAALRVERPADVLRDADVLHAAPRHAGHAVVDVGHVAGGDALILGACVGQHGRPRALAQRDGEGAREQQVAVDQLAAAVGVDEVEGEAVGVDAAGRGALGPRVRVRHEEAGLAERPGGVVEAAAVAHAAARHRLPRHSAFLHADAGRDDGDAGVVVGALPRIDEHHGAVGERVVACGDGHELRAVGHRACVAQGAGGAHVVLEERVAHRAVGANGPQGVDLHEVPLLVLPVGVGDAAVGQAVGVAVDVLVVGELPHALAVGRGDVEVGVHVVVGLAAALGRAAAAVGGEHDVAVRAVGRLEVVPVGVVGELAEASAIGADFVDVHRGVGLAQLEDVLALDVVAGRVHGGGPDGLARVAEHHAVGVPPQVEPPGEAAAEPALDEPPHLAVGPQAGQDADVAPGLVLPLVGAGDVAHGVGRELLDEDELVEVDRRVGHRDAAHGPAGIEPQPPVARQVGGCRLHARGQRVAGPPQRVEPGGRRREVGGHARGPLAHRLDVGKQRARTPMEPARDGLSHVVALEQPRGRQARPGGEPRGRVLARPHGLLAVVLAAHLHRQRPLGDAAHERVGVRQQLARGGRQAAPQAVALCRAPKPFGCLQRLVRGQELRRGLRARRHHGQPILGAEVAQQRRLVPLAERAAVDQELGDIAPERVVGALVVGRLAPRADKRVHARRAAPGREPHQRLAVERQVAARAAAHLERDLRPGRATRLAHRTVGDGTEIRARDVELVGPLRRRPAPLGDQRAELPARRRVHCRDREGRAPLEAQALRLAQVQEVAAIEPHGGPAAQRARHVRRPRPRRRLSRSVARPRLVLPCRHPRAVAARGIRLRGVGRAIAIDVARVEPQHQPVARRHRGRRSR